MANNKRNLIVRLQEWMDSVPGQMFMNYAYSWGAAIVILGTLFKLTYLPGANAMLFIGMGTEVLVFIISGFDRPAGLKRSEEDEKEDEEENFKSEEERETIEENIPQPQTQQPETYIGQPAAVPSGQPFVQQGPVIIGSIQPTAGTPTSGMNMTSGETTAESNGTPAATGQSMTNGSIGGIDAKLLAEIVNTSNAELLKAARQSCTPEMEEAAEAYIEELKKLTETLSRVSLQAESLTRDSKEMDNLNRVLIGINSIYEVQLKSISTQIGTIDQINEQTRKMAHQIEELNGIYSRMIKALTVNMKNAGGNVPSDQF